MRAKIQKWGNSLGLRLPKAITQEAHLVEGSVVEITADGPDVLVRSVGKSKFKLLDLLKAYPKKSKQEEELDWGEQRGHEEW